MLNVPNLIAYVDALRVLGFVIGGVTMHYLDEEQIHISDNLNFDYTKSIISIIVSCPSVSCGLNCKENIELEKYVGSRVIAPNQNLNLAILLKLSESDYNKKLGDSRQKKARFPKGKKVKDDDDELGPVVAVPIGPTVDLSDPQEAAKERARRRSGMTTELFIEQGAKGILKDVSAAEVTYKDNADFGDHGIQIEPFNLEQEREEGYFDDDGNFVEYVRENEIKDAWLDSVVVDSRYVGNKIVAPKTEEETPDLSPDDIGKMKRRIADLLEPEETVLQALRRLKGTSTDRKEKMPEDIKQMFDQLTEDSVKLMENGDYNVYHEKREVFVREAGTDPICLGELDDDNEWIVESEQPVLPQDTTWMDIVDCFVAQEGEPCRKRRRSRDFTKSTKGKNKVIEDEEEEIVGDIMLEDDNGGMEEVDMAVIDGNVQGYERIAKAKEGTSRGDDWDMFADDDENPSANDNGLVVGSTPDSHTQPSSDVVHTSLESGDAENDYVYDESSGYYYSSTLGYYYDPTSGLYCSANSGTWFAFNEQTGTYEEVQGEAENPTS
ncbi:hypothetical protein IFM89_005272 [Coptis chinensis]|uniref:OCRE domain-containing protein n=1 Tax=Coptis chinensis TaxID=261450 RepID=A0A835IRH6_9MAGN|nr:hypothetical protein IFM89_005272 [Coptis chinensis]